MYHLSSHLNTVVDKETVPGQVVWIAETSGDKLWAVEAGQDDEVETHGRTDVVETSEEHQTKTVGGETEMSYEWKFSVSVDIVLPCNFVLVWENQETQNLSNFTVERKRADVLGWWQEQVKLERKLKIDQNWDNKTENTQLEIKNHDHFTPSDIIWYDDFSEINEVQKLLLVNLLMKKVTFSIFV